MGKVVIITGASAGMGATTARFLAEKGYCVFGASRRGITGRAHDGFTELKMDVTDPNSVDVAISYVIDQCGHIDALVNNAGIGLIGSVEDSSDEETRSLFETNFFGLLNVCRVVLPHMRKAKAGRIINISSIAGKMGLPYRGIYSASKASVIMVTEAMSIEVQQFGIDVCAILPGDFKTSVNENRRVAQAGEHSDYSAQTASINRIVTEEVSQSGDPIKIARKIDQILLSKNPKLINKVGKPIQSLSAYIHDLLPSRWFEKILMRHYKL